MSEWFKKNGTKAQKFAHIEKQADSHKFLSGNLELVCEHLASYLVIYCVDLAVDPEVCSGAPTKTSVKEKERGLFLPWLVACVCVCVRVCARLFVRACFSANSNWMCKIKRIKKRNECEQTSIAFDCEDEIFDQRSNRLEPRRRHSIRRHL